MQQRPLWATALLSAECMLQLVHADPERLTGRPRYPSEVPVTLETKDERTWTGERTYEVIEETSGLKHQVELRLKVEKDRSLWAENTPRLTVTTRLKDGQNHLLTWHESHSDQLLTPMMQRWIEGRNSTRVVAQVWNPQVQEKLESITEPDVQKWISKDRDKALQKAVARKLISNEEIDRVDTVCILPIR